MKRLNFNKRLILSAISAFLFAAAAMSAARATVVTIESDPFTANPGTLESRPVQNPQKAGDQWDTGNTATDNTSVGSGILNIAPNGSFAKAYAPLDTSDLKTPYTLSLDLTFNPGAGNSTFNYYVGFGNSSSFSDTQAAVAFNIQSDTTGTSFTLNAGDGAFSDTLSTTVSRASTSTSYQIPLSITFDPKTELATFDVNGTSIGTTSYTGLVEGVTTKGDHIDAVTGYSGLEITNFKVTENIPEPSSYALLFSGLALLGLAARRRRAV